MEVVPDLSLKKNKKLTELTQDLWDDVEENEKKFLPAYNKELLEVVDQKLQSLGKKLKDLDLSKDLKNLEFKGKGLKKLNEKVKKQKISLYIMLNKQFLEILPYTLDDVKGMPESIVNLIHSSKYFLMNCVKNQYIEESMKSLKSSNTDWSLRVDRIKASQFALENKCDHSGKYTILGQILQSMK